MSVFALNESETGAPSMKYTQNSCLESTSSLLMNATEAAAEEAENPFSISKWFSPTNDWTTCEPGMSLELKQRPTINSGIEWCNLFLPEAKKNQQQCHQN